MHVELNSFESLRGYFLAAWSDGGYDAGKGGTAGYMICLQRNSIWQCLARGGVYDDCAHKDSLRMEAIGMEQLLSLIARYITRA